MKLKPQKLLFNFYLLLFPLTYLLLFTNYTYVTVPNLLIIGLSYYFMIFKNRWEPVLFLIIFARCLSGPTFPHNDIGFNIINALTGYIPAFLFLFREATFLPSVYLTKYKFSVCFAAIMVAYCLFDLSSAYYVLPTRIIPFILFVLCVYKMKLDTGLVLKYLRYLIASSLIILFLTDYRETLRPLVENAIVFKFSMAVGAITYGFLPRNSGVFFDPRLLGLFVVVFLYMVIILRKGNFFDILLGIICLATTLSRGSFVNAAVVLLGFSIVMLYRQTLIKKVSILFAIIVMVSTVSIIVSSNQELRAFLELSFSLKEEGSAIDQRAEFLEYSTNTFISYPWGVGNGVLKNPTIDRGFGFDENSQTYQAITDAFIITIAAELGILGFILFVLSAAEIMATRKDIVSYFLFIGFLIQCVGTDVPDIGMYYFAFLMIIIKTNQSLPALKYTLFNKKLNSITQ